MSRNPVDPRALAAAVLQFGKLLNTERDPAAIKEAEEKLILELSTSKSTLAKSAFAFNISTPIDAVALRLLSCIAYLQLCGSKLWVGINEVVAILAGDDVALTLEVRQRVSRLLLAKRLLLKGHSASCVELGCATLEFFAGGDSATPLVITERDLWNHWRKEDVQKQRRAGVAAGEVPTAKRIYNELSRHVVGQHELKVALSVAGRQTLLRREAARQMRPGCLPPKANVAVIGASGSGKSYACKILSQLLGLPFASLDASQLTASGFVGDDISSCLYLLSHAAGVMGVDPADGGLIHLDEVDKLSASNYDGPATVGVQFEALRLLDGAEVSYPVQGMNKWGGVSATMNTSNLMVVCSGAFSWLSDDLEGKKPGLGFNSGGAERSSQGNLRELLATRGGLIPELVNRFSAIVKMQPLTPQDIAAILLSEHGPFGEYRAMLEVEGRTLAVEPEAALTVGQWSVETGLLGRGPQAAMETLMRDPLFNGEPKDVILTRQLVEATLRPATNVVEDAGFVDGQEVIELSASEVRQAIEAAGLDPAG